MNSQELIKTYKERAMRELLANDEFLRSIRVGVDTPIDSVWYNRFILFSYTYGQYFLSRGLKYIAWEHDGRFYVKFVEVKKEV